MALEERTLLRSVEVNLIENFTQVCWTTQILRDGEVISEEYFRRAYIDSQDSEALQADLGDSVILNNVQLRGDLDLALSKIEELTNLLTQCEAQNQTDSTVEEE